MQERVYKKNIRDIDELRERTLKNGSGWTSLPSTLLSDSGAVD